MAVLPLVPSDEEALLRESVAGLCSRFGPAYMRGRIEASVGIIRRRIGV